MWKSETKIFQFNEFVLRANIPTMFMSEILYTYYKHLPDNKILYWENPVYHCNKINIAEGVHFPR